MSVPQDLLNILQNCNPLKKHQGQILSSLLLISVALFVKCGSDVKSYLCCLF